MSDVESLRHDALMETTLRREERKRCQMVRNDIDHFIQDAGRLADKLESFFALDDASGRAVPLRRDLRKARLMQCVEEVVIDLLDKPTRDGLTEL